MLLQSHNNIIRLLPALPAAWKDGEVKGLCARGGFEISMQWKNHQLIKATVYSKQGGKSKLIYNNIEKQINIKRGETLALKL